MKLALLARLAVVLVSGVPLVHAQWVHTGGPEAIGVYSLTVRGSTLFAGSDSGAFRSTDGGSHWARVDFGWDVGPVGAFIGDDSSFYARGAQSSLFYSADDGLSWRQVDTDLQNNWYPAGSPLGLHGKSLFASRSLGKSLATAGVYRSTDHGASWISVLPGLLANAFAEQDSVLLVACQDAVPLIRTHLYRSSDNGSHWAPVGGLFQYGGLAFAVHDGWLFSGGFGIYRSSDHGASWMSAQEGYGTREVSCFAEAPGALFVGSWGNGVHVSSDDGAHWKSVNEGLISTCVISLAVHDNTVYAGTCSAGVWRRPLSEFLTSVQGVPAPIPTSVALMQNYPNPFNPSTTIRYALPQRAHVTMTVFNMLGQRVATLVEGERESGGYEIQFDAAGLASGVYFYQLRAGGSIQTRRLVVQR